MTSTLYMLLLGCKPKGRNTEQHDTFFAIAGSLREVVPQISEFWPDAGTVHVDGWREVSNVDGYTISVHEGPATGNVEKKLFFLNLGGYKKDEFDEFHYKLLAVAPDKASAIRRAKQTAFYKHTGFKGAESHIDDKYGIDIDDVYEIEDILAKPLKQQFHIRLEKTGEGAGKEDEINLGYFKLNSL